MGTYRILEGNMERLEKKIQRIQNKCKKYNCEFHFEKVGEEIIEQKVNEGTDAEYTIAYKYIVVEAEGKAEINGWKFVCEINHTEHGNIFRGVEGIEVPERYYHTDTVCEHCNTNRRRRNTYLVQNIESGEFKQVGKSCLKDYTNGMDAEMVARMLDLVDEIVEGEAPNTNGRYIPMYKTERILACAVEMVRIFGYEKSDGYGWSTKERTAYAWEWHFCGGIRYKTKDIEEMIVKFYQNNMNPESTEVQETVKKALEWMQNIKAEGNYQHNAKVVANMEYVSSKEFGILVSIIPCYYKHIQRELEYAKEQKERAEKMEKERQSNHIGTVGERIKIRVANWEIIARWETSYGYNTQEVSVYKITDTDGNIYTWKTASYIPQDTEFINGTVKEHKEWNGIKQTELTRCKCIAKRFTLD